MDEKKTIPENTTVEIAAAENAEASSQETDLTTNTGEVVETPKKKPFWKSFKFISFVLLLLIAVVSILWLINAFNVYRNASKYQKTHDIAVREMQFCDSINGTSQSRDVFAYCDQLKERFREVER